MQLETEEDWRYLTRSVAVESWLGRLGGRSHTPFTLLISGLGSGIVVAGSGGGGETSGAFGVGNVDVVEMGVVERVGDVM